MFQHLFGVTLRGALVLLLVCTLSWPIFAGTKTQPVATSVSAYTSGSSTLITIYGTAPMAYSVSRPDARTIMLNLPGTDASRLADSYSVRSPLVETVVVERELRGPQDISTRMKGARRAPARERWTLRDKRLMLELTPAGEAAPKAVEAAHAEDASATSQQQ